MEKEINRIKAALLLIMLIFNICSFIVIFEIGDLKKENTSLKNDLNVLEAKIKIMDVVDDKIYTHIETLGNNDLMIQSWIEEINCYLYECRQEWSSHYE